MIVGYNSYQLKKLNPIESHGNACLLLVESYEILWKSY